jgi:hypothetical protein
MRIRIHNTGNMHTSMHHSHFEQYKFDLGARICTVPPGIMYEHRGSVIEVYFVINIHAQFERVNLSRTAYYGSGSTHTYSDPDHPGSVFPSTLPLNSEFRLKKML